MGLLVDKWVEVVMLIDEIGGLSRCIGSDQLDLY